MAATTALEGPVQLRQLKIRGLGKQVNGHLQEATAHDEVIHGALVVVLVPEEVRGCRLDGVVEAGIEVGAVVSVVHGGSDVFCGGSGTRPVLSVGDIRPLGAHGDHQATKAQEPSGVTGCTQRNAVFLRQPTF